MDACVATIIKSFFKSVLIALLAVPAVSRAQSSYTPGNGCLNVVSLTSGFGLCDYEIQCSSLNYMHEKFLNENLTIGAGVGYSYHKQYRLSTIPVYVSTHFFLFDKRCSPFINLRLGSFGMIRKKSTDINLKYSLADEQSDFNLFFSIGAGFKYHITPRIALMASVSDDFYLLKAYDTRRNDYRNKLLGNLCFGIAICFQIDNW